MVGSAVQAHTLCARTLTWPKLLHLLTRSFLRIKSRSTEKMLSGLLACMLVVGAVASQPGMPHRHDGPPHQHEEPERCCPPRYFTFDRVATSSSVEDGKLSVVMILADSAYDSISERYSSKLAVDFFNGTFLHVRFIDFFEEGVSYTVLEHQGESVCFKGPLKGKFPTGCLTDFKFAGRGTLGDFDLLVTDWELSANNGTINVYKTIQEHGCAPVTELIQKLDPVTRKEVEVLENRCFNIRLGICDPEKYFKIPETCETGRALEEPTPLMMKYRSKNVFHYF